MSKDNTLSTITHILGIFSNILGCLIVFLLTKDKLVKKHATNALNWQISFIIYLVSLLTISSLSALLTNTIPNIFIFFPFVLIYPTLTILNIIFSIIAAVKANNSELWTYPITIKFIKN
jgi:uncharacterized protein